MPLKVKICGITDTQALEAAREGGADFIGLVFYPPSPRFLDLDQAAGLAAEAGRMKKAGIFVDPDDQILEETLEKVPLDFIQLHGRESPGRVREIKEKLGLPVIKAIPVAGPEDLDQARKYADIADLILFDAAPGKDDVLPGGNARAFDHAILQGRDFDFPWILSGGLNARNLKGAVSQSGAKMVDVSSGVEQNPGRKDSRLIGEFLEKAKAL